MPTELEDIAVINVSHGGRSFREGGRIDFSSNLNPLGPPPLIHHLIEEALNLRTYMYFPSEKNLIEAIAEFEDANEEDIVVVPGASFAIHIIFEEIERESDTIVLQDLTYTDYYRYSEGRNRMFIKSIIENNKILLNIQRLENTLEHLKRLGSKVLTVIVNPNNPTGTYLCLNKLMDLLHTFMDYNIKFIIDISFVDFVGDREKYLSKLLELDNVYIVKSYTKILATPGIRLGILAAQRIRSSRKVKIPSWPISSICEYIICKLFKEYKYYMLNYIHKVQSYIKVEKPRVIEQLSRAGINVYDSDVHFFIVRTRISLDKYLYKHGIIIKKVCSLITGHNLFRVSILDREKNNILIDLLSSFTEGSS